MIQLVSPPARAAAAESTHGVGEHIARAQGELTTHSNEIKREKWRDRRDCKFQIFHSVFFVSSFSRGADKVRTAEKTANYIKIASS